MTSSRARHRMPLATSLSYNVLGLSRLRPGGGRTGSEVGLRPATGPLGTAILGSNARYDQTKKASQVLTCFASLVSPPPIPHLISHIPSLRLQFLPILRADGPLALCVAVRCGRSSYLSVLAVSFYRPIGKGGGAVLAASKAIGNYLHTLPTCQLTSLHTNIPTTNRPCSGIQGHVLILLPER